MKTKPKFSIILPIYNQQDHIKKIIENYKKSLKNFEDSYEILLIINGVKDGSYNFFNNLIDKEKNFRAFFLQEEGWGRAVKLGLNKALGEHICFTNSARTTLKDLLFILKFAKVNDEAVIKATRIVRDNLFRKIGSIFYNLECRLLFKIPVWDVNGTPKVIPKKILDTIELDSDDDLIDAELVVKCFKKNIPVVEVPVLLTKRVGGKSTTNIKSAIKMYYGLWKLKHRL